MDARLAKGRLGIYIRQYDHVKISLVNSQIKTDCSPYGVTSVVRASAVYAQGYKGTGTAKREVSLDSSRLEAFIGTELINEQKDAANANVKVTIVDNNVPSAIDLDEEPQDDIVEVTLKLRMPNRILSKFLEKFDEWIQQINKDNQDDKWSIQWLEN